MKKLLSRLLKWRSKPTPAVAKTRPPSAHEIALKSAEAHRRSEAGAADAEINSKPKPQRRQPAISEIPESRAKAGDKPAGARQRSDQASAGPAPAPKAEKKRKPGGKGADRVAGRSPARKAGQSGLTEI
jgi:hypothetical protein